MLLNIFVILFIGIEISKEQHLFNYVKKIEIVLYSISKKKKKKVYSIITNLKSNINCSFQKVFRMFKTGKQTKDTEAVTGGEKLHTAFSRSAKHRLQ